MNILKEDIIEDVYISRLYEEVEILGAPVEDGKYEGVTVMTDYFSEHLKIDERKFALEFNKLFSKLIAFSNNKESIIEQLPSQFLFNEDFKRKFIRILPVPENDILDIIKEWNKQTAAMFGGTATAERTIKEIYWLAFPYVYLALTVKSDELSMNILMMLNMLMYSLSYAIFFPKYNYIKDKGEYVIQNILKNKSIAKFNNWYDLMAKTSQDTKNTYVNRVTDRNIYVVTYSNIQQKMKYHMKEFYQAYTSIGNKYLTTSKDIMSTTDREGNDTNVESNIENNSAVVLKISKLVTGYVSNPTYIESDVMKVALSKMMGINTNIRSANTIDKRSLVERNLYSMVEEIQKTRDFETIISNILQNFLWTDGSSVKHIETPMFIEKIMYDLSYIGKNKIYVNNIIGLLDKYIDIVLDQRGKSTTSVDNKTLQRYRKTIIFYFSYLTQKVVKRS